MKILIVKKLFGNGTVYEYSKVISSDKDKKKYTPPVPGSFEEKHEKYRQKVKNSRLRAATRSMSFDFYFHTVFTTANKKISHDPELFIQLVISILKKQNINYFLVLELNHPRTVWQYDWEEDKNEGIKADEIINRYGCYNRICLAPLSENEGFHIHVLTDRPVNFEEWIENYGGDPKNLYCEIFYHDQFDNVKYILKYFYYTKSVLPDNFHIYRSNIKKIKSGTVISEKDLDTGIVDVLYSSFREKEIKEERRLQRKYYSNLNHNLCNLNTNLFKYIKKNHSFWNVLNKQNVLLFSFYHFNNFINNIHINTNIFNKISNLSYSFYTLLPYENVTSSNILYFDFNSFINKKGVRNKKAYLKSSIKGQDSKIKAFVSDIERKNAFDPAKKSSKYIEFSFEKSNTEQCACSVPFSWENWLLKYIVFIKTIPKNG